MASLTLTLGTTFPDGTSVGAYPASAWSGQFAEGTPRGSATDTQTVSGGTVTFTGLADGTEYYAAGQVSGSYRYVQFYTAPAAEGGGASTAADVSVDNFGDYDVDQLQELADFFFTLFGQFNTAIQARLLAAGYAPGDVLVANSSGELVSLGIGTDGQVPNEPLGVKWATPA